MVNNRAEIIRNLRRSLLLEPSEMSKILDISPSTYCNYEAGKRSPRMSVVRRMLNLAKDNSLEFPAEVFLDN
jgi:predicted transcriptional regulator